ncbi:MAG: type II toxin-antitoxin system VapB family antitoxin [Rhodospirillales bacterium]|nr:type II toxin-antitoxin system VapB family antitoxin [Rhodospirillales bacterium]
MATAKLFKTGRSQAVRLPRAFRFEGQEIRIRRFGLGVLLEPAEINAEAWFGALDRFRDPFMAEGREQPATRHTDRRLRLSYRRTGRAARGDAGDRQRERIRTRVRPSLRELGVLATCPNCDRNSCSPPNSASPSCTTSGGRRSV